MKKHLRAFLGIAVSLLLLYWSLRDVSFSEVARRIREADMVLLTLSVVITIGGFYIRAIRWGVLLRPVAGSVAFRPRVAGVFIGFGINNVLPARVGEIARVYALSRLTNVKAGSAFATLVIERLLDGFSLVALMFIVLASPDFPANSSGGVDVRSGALAAATVLGTVGFALVVAVVAPRQAAVVARAVVGILPVRFRDPALGAMRSFASGLAVLRSAPLFVLSVLLAFGQWAFLATAFVVGFRAFDIHSIPYSGGVFLQSLMSFAVAVPSSPGFFGPFEAGARLGLSLYGVPSDQAVSWAIGYHIAGFIPVTLAAFWYIWRLDLSWSAMKSGENDRSNVDPEEVVA